MRAAIVTVLLLVAGTAHAQDALFMPLHLRVEVPRNDPGTHLNVKWAGDHPPPGVLTVVARHSAARDAERAVPPAAIAAEHKAGDDLGDGWTIVYWGEADEELTDDVDPDGRYVYAAWHVRKDDAGVWTSSEPGISNAAAPVAAFFNTDRWFYLLLIFLTGGAFALYLGYAKKNAKTLFIRRIPGVDAIEDAIGRSTEMGRPILYVTGIEEITDIQTIASLLILGHVAEMTAEYDTDIKVANTYPMTMVVAEEIVRQGYANAGRLDAHRPENVMFITSEQFAFAAAVNGMILRDKPATNIYFGRFFAESLLLAETGFLTGAVQIAGTAEFTQLPFFIAACDYTLLGEELYAVSAYLSREPTLLAQLKAGDVVKAFAMLLIIAGVIIATVQGFALGGWLMP
jgi:hypothetical protein